MSNRTKTCPVCGEVVDADEVYCPACGENLSGIATEQLEVAPADYVDRSVSTGGGRNNIMGDNIVNAQDQSTTNNIDNSQTTNTSTVHNVQNTSSSVTNQQTVGSIDNSQQVVNNITIIGGAGMTLPGGLAIPGNAQQSPTPSGPPSVKGSPARNGNGYGGSRSEAPGYTPSAKSGGYAAPVDKSSGGVSKLVTFAGVAALVVIAFVLLRGRGDTPQEEPAVVEQETPVQEVAPTRTVAPRVETVREAAPVQVAPVQAAPAQVATDANYEAGMAAYNSGDGLEAVRKFQDSGSPQALYMLGVIYEKGCGGVEANAMKARSFFKKAAAQGHSDAKSKL